MLSRFALTTLVVLLFSSFAHAGFYIEPMAAYHGGNIEYTVKPGVAWTGSRTDKATLNGLSAGLGFGWRFDNGFILGIDAQGAVMQAKWETSGETEKWTQTMGYLSLGYQVKPELDVYIGLGQMTAVDDQTPKTTMTGSAVKLGAGYKSMKYLTLNAEFVMYMPHEAETGGVKTKVHDVYESYQYVGYLVNARVPFSFDGR